PSLYISTQTAPWTDLNSDDIAQATPGCVYLSTGCEINYAAIPANFGVASLASPDPNIKRPYVDQFNLGATHHLLPGGSVSAEWFHNSGKNIWERNNVLRPGTYQKGTVTNSNYRAITIFSPIDGAPITMYDPINTTVSRAVQNVDSNDSSLSQKYNAF